MFEGGLVNMCIYNKIGLDYFVDNTIGHSKRVIKSKVIKSKVRKLLQMKFYVSEKELQE